MINSETQDDIYEMKISPKLNKRNLGLSKDGWLSPSFPTPYPSLMVRETG